MSHDPYAQLRFLCWAPGKLAIRVWAANEYRAQVEASIELRVPQHLVRTQPIPIELSEAESGLAGERVA